MLRLDVQQLQHVLEVDVHLSEAFKLCLMLWI